MTIPANLFVEAPEVQDRSLTRLDSDIKTWPEEIIQKLRERAPQTSNMNCMVKFMKKDEENGTATGSVIVNTPTAGITVPVIIKDFTLYPLDVMIAKGRILPLTPDYVTEVFSNNEVFNKIEEYPSYGGLGRFEEANLWNSIYPPSLGRYAYASAGYPLLDLISDDIDGAPLKDWLKENPAHAVSFHKFGHAPLIKKLANLKPVNMNEFSQGARNLVPTIKVLKLEGPNKYSLLSSSDKVFSPAIEILTRHDCKKVLSEISDRVEDDMNDVDQNGEKIVMSPHGGETILARPESDKDIPEEAKEYDNYVVKTMSGLSLEGVVIPKVIDFEQKPVDLKIFIGKTMSTIQKSIWGARLQNSRFVPPISNPKIGQTGTFIYQPDKSHALATIPVTIRSLMECPDGSVLFKVQDLLGKGYHLKMCPGMHLKRIALLDDTYILPREMKWVVMEGFGTVSSNAESYSVRNAIKTANWRSSVKLIPNGFNAYTLKGVEKYAKAAGWDYTNLDSAKTKFLLCCLGLPQTKIAEAFKTASRRGAADICEIKLIPTMEEKTASFQPKIDKLAKAAASVRRNLFKEASYIDNAQTVDALLSLNFVSPSNITKFVGKLPHFKATISNLASALLASRLGMKEIPEEASAVAMNKLIEVVDGLERLRASQEVAGAQ